MQRREVDLDLAEAALTIAKLEYPRLQIPAYLAQLDELAAAVERRLLPGATPRERLDKLIEVLFRVEGFRGNEEAYYDPRNSYLNQVLDRRLGIPITLSLICMEVGRRLGLRLDGIGFPGRFLVRYQDETESLLFDVYQGGVILTPAQCAALLRELYGGQIRFHQSQLAALTKRQILTRMLNNLKAIYLRHDDFARAWHIADLLVIVNPSSLDEIRDRGLIALRAGEMIRGLADLETYLRFSPDARDAATVREQCQRAWQRWARSN
jgi:regulator of sirC expression with transglutaminase-like and TPR domain